MYVLKFGGSSVADAVAMKKTAAIIVSAAAENKVLVVASATGGTTDMLLQSGEKASAGDPEYKELVDLLKNRHLELVRNLMPITEQSSMLSFVLQQFNLLEELCNGIFILRELSPKSRDRVAAFGEILSTHILSAYLKTEACDNLWVDSRSLIQTNSAFTKATVNFHHSFQKIQDEWKRSPVSVMIIPGFIAADEHNDTTTLGRGGSDYTAAIAGAALDAEKVEIWTDVSGIMTADPRLVPNAKNIPELSYQETMELSHFGAKVIYPPTIQPLMQKNIPVWIKNTFAPDDKGSLIRSVSRSDAHAIRGISSIGKIALLSLEGSGMVGIPGFSKRLFETLAFHAINVVLITQASSEHSICVGIEEASAAKAKKLIDQSFSHEIENNKVNPILVEKGLAVIALVGDNMKSHVGVSGRMFSALGRNGINIRAIAQGSSERNISVVIHNSDVQKGINVLHEDFFESVYKQVNIFLTGTGNVGSKLIAQLHSQVNQLQKKLRLQIRIVGMANSRKMLIKEKGIDLLNWKEQLAEAKDMNLMEYIEQIKSKNLRNSIFVDVTANEQVASTYETLLRKSISVVACNKIACSSTYSHYRNLKDLSDEGTASFLFETNVGAGLPVIGTLNDLIRSGDQVKRIEAVLSGTLNYVFNHYDTTESFASVVRKAQEEGYTEPDPRLDLSGTDVMRKIMILAREAGETLEMHDIENTSFMPPSCMEGSVENFYAEMEKEEAYFKQLYNEASIKSCKLKFVAHYSNGKAKVGLQHIDSAHNLFHLYGKDNIVLFYTSRYPEQPLVIKGAGAGAEVTASGVFADIIRASSLK